VKTCTRRSFATTLLKQLRSKKFNSNNPSAQKHVSVRVFLVPKSDFCDGDHIQARGSTYYPHISMKPSAPAEQEEQEGGEHIANHVRKWWCCHLLPPAAELGV
jgi:hypothetical protein